MNDVQVLDVLLHGTPVATLVHTSGERIFFTFSDDYVADSRRPVLGLSFKDEYGALITDFRPTRASALPFFSNLLPEGPLRAILAGRAGVHPAREFFLLRALGRDLPGAITMRPAGDNRTADPRSEGLGEADRGEGALRFSLAGTQLKFPVTTGDGPAVPANGVGGSWIIKLPSPRFPGLPENEYAMMTLARCVGLDVPDHALADVREIENLPGDTGPLHGQALAVRRFDRQPDGTGTHIEDFAQVFAVYPGDKYRKASARSIARVIGAECSDTDICEFIRRLTFSMLIGNADLHLKNWSLVYPDRRHAALAPAYDLVSTIPYIPDTKAALHVSRTNRFDEFSAGELSHLAAGARLAEKPVLDTAHETVARFHQHWQGEKAHLPVSPEVIRAIEAHLKTIPIARQ